MVILGEGELEFTPDQASVSPAAFTEREPDTNSFAPPNTVNRPRQRPVAWYSLDTTSIQQTSFSRLHDAWSTAVNSRLRARDNARFLEHFRYIIIASQLLNEYLDLGFTHPASPSTADLGNAGERVGIPTLAVSIYGASITAVAAFLLVYAIQWARGGREGPRSKTRPALALSIFALAVLIGYGYVRRQWLRYLRRQAVDVASTLTNSWQALETTSSGALSFIQEVELVSKGYKLSTPLSPASRVEEAGTARRCQRLRQALYRSYSDVIPACIDTYGSLSTIIDRDDLERYYEVYDIGLQDVKEATSSDALSVLDEDSQSLKSLRILNYREGVLRRIILCSLLSLKADGGKPDFARWSTATEVMNDLNRTLSNTTERLKSLLAEMQQFDLPSTPQAKSPRGHGARHDRMRGQMHKISMLSSGIRALQAKMQILREETNRSIEQSEDLTDLGPHLMAQYDSIGSDLKELLQAWEVGKASLVSSMTKHENRISMVSNGLRSPSLGSSLGGSTAVDEDGSPAAALRALTGDAKADRSNRSSMNTSSSDEVFEAVAAAAPRQRSTLTREERIAKMYEERERLASVRAQRDANTNMLRELESVINLRPKKPYPAAQRIMSL